MSAIFQVILSAISGAIIGSVFFGLWLGGLMFVYISFYGSYSLGSLFLGEFTLEKPVFLSFIAGLIFGGAQGFCVGLIIKSLGTSDLSKNILISFIITEILIAALFLLISFDTNPISMIADAFIGRFYDLAKTSLVLLIPSILIGTSITKLISFITSK